MDLLQGLAQSLKEVVSTNQVPRIGFSVNQAQGQLSNVSQQPDYRHPINGGQILNVSVSSPRPAPATVSHVYTLWLPKDADGQDDILVKCVAPEDSFTARMDEVLPTVTGTLQIRIRLFAERVLASVLAELNKAAATALSKNR